MTSEQELDIGLTGLLERIAERHPETDVRFGEQTIRSADLLVGSARLAAGLSEWGVGPGDHVAIWMRNRIEWLQIWAAVVRLGAVIVPLNTRFSVAEAEYVLRHSGSSHLIWAADHGALDEDAVSAITSRCPELHSLARAGGEPGIEGELCLDDLDLEEVSAVAEVEGTVGMVLYTSGSTAFPKGAKLRTTGLVRNGHGLGKAWQMDSTDRVLCSNPLFHCGGSVFAFMAGFSHGASVTLMDRWKVEHAVELIRQEKITVAPVIDAALRDLVDHCGAYGVDLPTLRLASTAADRVLFERVHEILDCEISNVYGLTEASPNVCVGYLTDTLEKRLAHIGPSQPGIEVDIRDPETGAPLPFGDPGEIVVRGWNVMEAYHADEEATEAAFTDDGFLRSGDLGRIWPDGYLDYLGRAKLMIKSGGENIAIEEVETALRTHDDIADAIVVPVPHPRFTEVGFAYLRPREGVRVSPESVLRGARGRLAGYKVPKHAAVVSDLPRTGSGKVDRVSLTNSATQAVEEKDAEVTS